MKSYIHTTKLNRELFRDFALGNLKLSKSAIHLMLRLTPHIDRDGRIYFDKKTIKKEMYCDNRYLNVLINELRTTEYNGKKLLTYQNGYYISHFHVSTNGVKSYLGYYPIFTHADFLNLTLKQTRLFFYIATLNVKGQYVKVSVENLYKNMLHDKELGMSFYHNYISMAEDLFKLIDLGLVLVRLPGDEEGDIYINKNTPNYEKLFHSLCNYVNDRKKRTSKIQKEKHLIGLKVNHQLTKEEVVGNDSSKTELRMLTERYFLYFEDMKEKTVNIFISKKNEMMEMFGEAGLAMYRTSLEKYFEEKHEFILYYDQKDKAVNHFTDFYLLEEVKRVILGAIKSITEGREVDTYTDSGFPFPEVNIPLLVQYFVANSSDEHKVIIDQDIQYIENAFELMTGNTAEQPWEDLQQSIDATYAKHIPTVEKNFIEECEKNGVEKPFALLTTINLKELVVKLAEKSLLSQKRIDDEEAKKLKQVVRFFRKKQFTRTPYDQIQAREVKQIASAAPLNRDDYPNWLED